MRKEKGQRPVASQELLDLWARVLEAPYKYRLTDLDSRTTWALNLRDGRLVPEVEVPCAQPVMMRLRAEGPDGLVGDGAIEIWPGHPQYEQQKAELDRRERILGQPGRTARKGKGK